MEEWYREGHCQVLHCDSGIIIRADFLLPPGESLLDPEYELDIKEDLLRGYKNWGFCPDCYRSLRLRRAYFLLRYYTDSDLKIRSRPWTTTR